MGKPRHLIGWYVLVPFVAVAITGCPKPTETSVPAATVPARTDTATTEPAQPEPATVTPQPETPQPETPAPKSGDGSATGTVKPNLNSLPTKLWEPTVILSGMHRQTCKVGTGDKFPEMALRGIDGNEHRLADLLGSDMTVVLFWNAKNPYAREEFLRLEREVANRYPGWGINVVAVNVGDPESQVRQIAATGNVSFPVLLDPDQAAMKKVAEDILPRTYLLDAQGNILWLDIEYSRSTSRELRNAIGYQFRGRTT